MTPRLPKRRRLYAKKLVFLGSPAVAASALEALVAKSPDDVEVVGCVSQPPAPKGRRRELVPCDVQVAAERLGLPTLTPVTAKDPEFLAALEALEPDLCVTAAFGQFLPRRFLEIPKFGTWNIHPSLLPLYRGAAPLQRSLENGDNIVGVTLLETVLKMDAGPIVAQVERVVERNDTAPALLDELFLTGVDLLLDRLPQLFAGTLETRDQDDDRATAAPKLTTAEAQLDLSSPPSDARSIAQRARDKVRAFAPWPGTWIAVRSGDTDMRLKVLEARVGDATLINDISLVNNALAVKCPDGSILELLRVTPPGRKPVDAISFWNGLRGEPLTL